MAALTTSISSVSITSGSQLNSHELRGTKLNSLGHSRLSFQKKPKQLGSNMNLSVRAGYDDGGRDGSGDFIAGFFLGGAVFGTLAYIFAPQIRRSILNEDEHGFRRPKRPIYYEEDQVLEKTRQTLNAKIGQLNNAIDNVSSRLMGGKKLPKEPVEMENDPEEATI